MVEVLAERRFLGRIEAETDVGAIRVFESRYEPGLSLPLHAHENAHLCFVVDGTYTEQLGTVSLDRRPGTVVYYRPGSAHAERYHTAGRHLLVELTPEWSSPIGSGSDGLPSGATLGGPGAILLTARIRNELRMNDSATPLIVEGLLFDLLGWLHHGAERSYRLRGSPWLACVLEMLASRFQEKLTLQDVANAAGVHPAHLTRAFRREFGCTIGDHVRRLRIDHACRRIAGTDEPLSGIAVDAGFSDQSHLCRCIKARFGRTPAMIRADRGEF